MFLPLFVSVKSYCFAMKPRKYIRFSHELLNSLKKVYGPEALLRAHTSHENPKKVCGTISLLKIPYILYIWTTYTSK